MRSERWLVKPSLILGYPRVVASACPIRVDYRPVP